MNIYLYIDVCAYTCMYIYINLYAHIWIMNTRHGHTYMHKTNWKKTIPKLKEQTLKAKLNMEHSTKTVRADKNINTQERPDPRPNQEDRRQTTTRKENWVWHTQLASRAQRQKQKPRTKQGDWNPDTLINTCDSRSHSQLILRYKLGGPATTWGLDL